MNTIKTTSENEISKEIEFFELLQEELGVIIKGEPEDKDTKKYGKKGNIDGQVALKRAMSGEPEHIRKVYKFLPNEIKIKSEWAENHIWIPVACLFVYYPQKIDRDRDPKKSNFGKSCLDLAIAIDKTGQSKGIQRRFKALLDTSLTDLRSPLNNLVRQMKSKDVSIDYPQLLIDLQQWEQPKQYIQDRWARTYWRAAPPDPKEPIEESTESTEIDN